MRAEIILCNAHVITMNPAQPQAQAVALRKGRITAVGSEAEVMAQRGAHTTVIDAQGCTLLPGLIDSHFHLFNGARLTSGMDVRGLTQLEQLQPLLAQAAQQTSGWLIATGASYSLPSPQRPLTRQDLDSVLPDVPLVLIAHDLHALWMNTAALRASGLLQGSDDPALQVCMTMAADGSATGEIIEGGVFIISARYLPNDEAQTLQALERSLVTMASYGICSVHNMLGDAQQGAFYHKLEQQGSLSARVSFPLHVTPGMSPEAMRSQGQALERAYNSDRLRFRGVKFFADGVYDGKTALTLYGYPDAPNDCGHAVFAAEEYRQLVLEADRQGWPIATHAVGNGAVRLALDAYEAAQQHNGKRDARHRIEHIEICDPADIPRFAQLGVIASMQPLHVPSLGDGDAWLSHVAVQEWPYAFAFRRLRDAGARLAFGSDWCVVSMNPFESWQAALTRQPWGEEGDAHYQQSLHEVLAGYTCDAAYAESMEAHKGQLAVGMLADLCLLSADVESLEPEALGTLRSLLTIVGGKICFQA